MDLKEFTALVYLYFAIKERFEVLTSEAIDTIDTLKAEGSTNNQINSYFEGLFGGLHIVTGGKSVRDYAPSIIIEMKDKLGVFKDMPPEHISTIYEIADEIIEGMEVEAFIHGSEWVSRPYGPKVKFLLKEIFYKGDKRIREIFKGVTYNEFERVWYGLDPDDLEGLPYFKETK